MTARGRTVVEVASRSAVLAALEARPEAALPLIGAALDARDAGEPAALDLDRVARALRLVPMSEVLTAQLGADGVAVSRFPFVVGRKESRWEENGARGVDLVLGDRQPYNLSRRHFAIERADGHYLVRDCGSHHGTFVNGERIGPGAKAVAVALVAGENRIVAGTAASPIRFSFLVD